ncbi:hypothetical protein [uncultured Parasphingorhabdus sp.]|nr:hypothetical protein [uncultured Parasphingorhabdus sp.]
MLMDFESATGQAGSAEINAGIETSSLPVLPTVFAGALAVLRGLA